METIYTSVQELIGRTPLLELTRIEKAYGLSCRLLAKLESCNPGGSVKDRVAKSILDDAESRGKLKQGSVIIEPTSGNTGIGLCALAAARGYRCIIVMPDSMSQERQLIMAAYGAEVVLSPGKEGMSGAIRLAEALAARQENSFIAGQFVNPANPEAHFTSTGPEIWADTDGHVDIFVAGVGTGGTLTGTARYLKQQNPSLQAVAVEPAGSAVLSGKPAGSHGLQGIGAGFIPEIMELSLADEIFTVTQEQAFSAARQLAQIEGVLAGISSGAALHAAIEIAKRPENTDKTLVTILPDSGERYLSTALFA